MAIGALAVLLALFFLTQYRALLEKLPLTALVVAVVVLGVLLLATSIEPLESLANLVAGAILFLLACQLSIVQESYINGNILFAFFFLILVAIFIKRPRYAD